MKSLFVFLLGLATLALISGCTSETASPATPPPAEPAAPIATPAAPIATPAEPTEPPAPTQQELTTRLEEARLDRMVAGMVKQMFEDVEDDLEERNTPLVVFSVDFKNDTRQHIDVVSLNYWIRERINRNDLLVLGDLDEDPDSPTANHDLLVAGRIFEEMDAQGRQHAFILVLTLFDRHANEILWQERKRI